MSRLMERIVLRKLKSKHLLSESNSFVLHSPTNVSHVGSDLGINSDSLPPISDSTPRFRIPALISDSIFNFGFNPSISDSTFPDFGIKPLRCLIPPSLISDSTPFVFEMSPFPNSNSFHSDLIINWASIWIPTCRFRSPTANLSFHS